MDKIEYDFYENPNSKSDNSKSKYHIRICRRQKISTKSMANRLSKYTTLTPTDIYATITALQDAISGELGAGNEIGEHQASARICGHGEGGAQA